MKTCVGIVGIAVAYAALAVPAPVAAQGARRRNGWSRSPTSRPRGSSLVRPRQAGVK